MVSIVSAASAAVQVIHAMWQGLQRLFGGGEEGVVVNPARDAFFGQFVSQFGGTPFEALAAAFGAAGISGGVAEQMIRALYDAETMDAFRPAAQAIVDALNAGGVSAAMNFHTGGMVPGNGEVNATLLGSERVLNRDENRMFSRLSDEISGLRRDMRRDIGRSMADALTLAPGWR